MPQLVKQYSAPTLLSLCIPLSSPFVPSVPFHSLPFSSSVVRDTRFILLPEYGVALLTVFRAYNIPDYGELSCIHICRKREHLLGCGWYNHLCDVHIQVVCDDPPVVRAHCSPPQRPDNGEQDYIYIFLWSGTTVQVHIEHDEWSLD